MLKNLLFFLFTSALFISAACNREKQLYRKTKPSFKRIIGINYTEVKRKFDTGLSFDDRGYQLEPSWQLRFISEDTVKIFSPEIKKFMPYRVYYDHDSVINTAMVWLRVKHVSKDSLKLQVLRVENKKVSGKNSNLYMTLYSDQYIKSKNADVNLLRNPTKKDSLFVQKKILEANRDFKFFGARKPVMLISKSPIINVKKIVGKPDMLNTVDPADEYLYPQFNITINRAYKDFSYSFSVYVDEEGKMHFNRSEIYIMPESEEGQIKIMKGIMDVYLRNLLKIIPGSTLGMNHTSLILLNVNGIKIKK